MPLPAAEHLGRVATSRLQHVPANAQPTTTARGDDTSYTLTSAGGRAAMIVRSATALSADSSALPHTTCVSVPPSVSVYDVSSPRAVVVG